MVGPLKLALISTACSPAQSPEAANDIVSINRPPGEKMGKNVSVTETLVFPRRSVLSVVYRPVKVMLHESVEAMDPQV